MPRIGLRGNSVLDFRRANGHVFFSTINRNPKSYLFAIVGAEYVLRLLPKGTHDYQKFISPSELATWIRAANLNLKESIGWNYLASWDHSTYTGRLLPEDQTQQHASITEEEEII